MKFKTSIVLSVLFISANVKAELNKNCQVKNKYIGKCTYLTDCPYYDHMIQNYLSLGYKPDDIFQIFREINCGFVVADALVCCPPSPIPQAVAPPPNNSAGNSVPQESTDAEVILQPTNSSMSDVPPNASVTPIQAPVPSAPPLPPVTTASTTTSTTTPTPISTTASTTTPTTTSATIPTTTLTTTATPITTTASTTTSRTAPITGSPEESGSSNSTTIQTDKPTISTETTTTEASQILTTESTINGLDIAKFKRLLPDECGRVFTFKYFRGNRTEFDDFPWATLIEYETPTGKQFGCGGALINNRYVLTAAHCVTGLPSLWKVSTVRFGEYDTDTAEDCLPDGPTHTICNAKPLDVGVEEVVVHPRFTPADGSRLHDIALLRLSIPISFTGTRRPICLPTKNTFPQKYYTSGWGKDLVRNSIRNGTNLKYMSYVSLIEHNNCQKKYLKEGVSISQSHLCGGVMANEKPCIGDGGGPLMGLEERPDLQKRVAAFGVLSTNKPATGECLNGSPSVYTKVLDYMNWIVENLKE